MKFKEFDMNLDIKKNKRAINIEMVQGDTKTNVLNISLMDKNEKYEVINSEIEVVF